MQMSLMCMCRRKSHADVQGSKGHVMVKGTQIEPICTTRHIVFEILEVCNRPGFTVTHPARHTDYPLTFSLSTPPVAR